MAEKLTLWKSKDGKHWATEIEALRADVKFLEQEVLDWENKSKYWEREAEDRVYEGSDSSYGSSGGGGHD